LINFCYSRRSKIISDIKWSDAWAIFGCYGDGDWPQIDANKLPENPSLLANIFHALPSLVAAAGMRDEGRGERDGSVTNDSCAVTQTVVQHIHDPCISFVLGFLDE